MNTWTLYSALGVRVNCGLHYEGAPQRKERRLSLSISHKL